MSFVQAETWLSATRFAPFLNDTEGDYERALELYGWHAEMTAACFENIHHFEVVTRNAIDGTLGRGQPQEPLRDTWLMDFSTLEPNGVKQVIMAVERFEKGEAITRGRAVAGLSFGFWAGLFSKSYEELWRQRLRYAFPYGQLTRKDLTQRMRALQRFRNRIAHHGCLLAEDLEGRIDEMFEIVGWIDPDARRWLEARSRVRALLVERPAVESSQACPAAGTTIAATGSSR